MSIGSVSTSSMVGRIVLAIKGTFAGLRGTVFEDNGDVVQVGLSDEAFKAACERLDNKRRQGVSTRPIDDGLWQNVELTGRKDHDGNPVYRYGAKGFRTKSPTSR